MLRRKICILLAALLAVTAVLGGCSKKEQASSDADKAISVQVEPAKERDITLTTVISGKISPIQEAGVLAKLQGQIESVNVEIGDYVSAGDILFTMDSDSLRASYQQAQAAYNSSRAGYEKAQQASANAKLNLERNRMLYEQGAISKQAYENMQLQAMDQDLEMARYGVESAQAAVQSAGIMLDNAVVRAPISGTVALVSVQKGSMPPQGMPSIVITDSSRVQMDATVSEYLINKIKKGEELDVRIKSASSKPFKGMITAMSDATASGSMTYPIKIELENPQGLIKAGMFAEVDIATEGEKGVLSVPSEAVLVKGGEKLLFAIEDGKAKARKVETGIDDGKFVKIISGIKKGEQIAVKGQNYLDDGSKVKISGQESAE